jgi:Holliday junction resolvase
MRLRAKVDNNQREIVKALRAAGHHVLSLAAIGKGIPDLLVTTGDETFLAEVKDGTGKKLTPDQVEFHAKWKGRIEIFTGVEQALEITDGSQKRLRLL